MLKMRPAKVETHFQFRTTSLSDFRLWELPLGPQLWRNCPRPPPDLGGPGAERVSGYGQWIQTRSGDPACRCG